MSINSTKRIAADPASWYDQVMLATLIMALGNTSAIRVQARIWGNVASPAAYTRAPPPRLTSNNTGIETNSAATEQRPIIGAHHSQ